MDKLPKDTLGVSVDGVAVVVVVVVPNKLGWFVAAAGI